ncbi:MAG: sigma-54-dependent Fis family transcriptional regulator [Flavobacteriales bacterium]|nr:sigma-54-dependent Fis family transcriptional regulator [Flavobacteriales bacterium]
MEIQSVKQRFGIIGNSPLLNRAIDIAMQVAPTDISVLISGESGTGKEVMPQIIHNLSHRKHGKYIAVNCGAIPEGTIDSEFFGHEKGSFTGASETRKGYFEVADGGTVFLDEVAEMPLQTQVRLLRVLETGEFIKVGSSKTQKTDVRIVAATNKDIPEEIKKGRFREDLYYRLNTVPITLPPLRKRREDILLIFRKFAVDYSDKYRMPSIKLTPEAEQYLVNHSWPGNIRQLRNLTEQMSVIEKSREIDPVTLQRYLPVEGSRLPAIIDKEAPKDMSEREILYKVLFDMRNDMNQLKALVGDMMTRNSSIDISAENEAFVKQITNEDSAEVPSHEIVKRSDPVYPYEIVTQDDSGSSFEEHEEVEESLSLVDHEKELIIKALKKHGNRRKKAAEELGISERTLYRKIKEYDIV